MLKKSSRPTRRRLIHLTAALMVIVSIGIRPDVVRTQEELREIAFEKYRLANGLDVILHVDRSLPVITVNVWYHVGSKNEKAGRTGFAHLFEHLMF